MARRGTKEKDDMPPLNIIVCVKPVPDPKQWGKLKLDPETMLLCREGIPAVVNPLDRTALAQALALRGAHGGRISVLCMAPPEGEDQLREALATGCDQAYLLTDRAFAGADTMATARCLAAAIRKIGAFDLILCGAYSLDGSTAQVGPQVAELLGLPDLSQAVEIELQARVLRGRCKSEGGWAGYETELPALVTLAAEAAPARLPSMVGIGLAATAEVTVWKASDLGVKAEEVGLAGSPTQMLNVFSAPAGRKGEILQGPPDEVASQLLDKLHHEQSRPERV
jgi:electron transfer flavoprotein beta subunit